jgi:phosphate transport system permease protein
MRERVRNTANLLALSVCGLMCLLAMAPLVAMLYHVVRNGAPQLNVAFFTQMPKPLGEPGGGLLNAIVGSLVLIALASVIGVPVGVMAGAFLARAGGSRAAFWVRYAADVLSGIPSIVLGVVVYELVVVPTHGFSAVSGGIALALIMIPTVVRTTEEMIRLVPHTLYEAALALGATEWRATWSVLFKGARSGIVTGVMLAAARVAGETAPLLFTSFNNQFWSVKLTQPISSLPVQIFNYAVSPWDEFHRKAWAGALVLVMLVLGLSILTRLATRGRYEIIQ